jgi:light-independent protochlorophyllide reductase subunit B
MGIRVNVIAPWSASPHDLARLTEAEFNVVMYPEIAQQAANWLKRTHGMPFTTVVPIGVRATREFITEVAQLAGIEADTALEDERSRAAWYAKSVDSTYLTGKRVFVFGDATHVIAAARVAAEEFGFEVVGLGTYSREFAREVRAAAERYGVEALITDDYLEVEARVAELSPELVLGTQMERHIAKRLGLPCAVISAPVHVQDFPARHSPQMGFEGANVLFDSWVHPLMMGLEEHLIAMFKDDFEFNEHAAPSHLGKARTPQRQPSEAPEVVAPAAMPEPANAGELIPMWSNEAERELGKIPFFVRGKARRNTENFAKERGVQQITIETLYDAKAHYSR